MLLFCLSVPEADHVRDSEGFPSTISEQSAEERTMRCESEMVIRDRTWYPISFVLFFYAHIPDWSHLL